MKPDDRAPPSELEAFWAGDFGDAYARRNVGEDLVAANTAFFARVLRAAGPVASVLELGAGTGLNLLAIRRLVPKARLTAVEINPHAEDELRRLADVEVVASSVHAFAADRTWDLVLTKGLLIHIEPDRLESVYRTMHGACGRYVCIAEYYNPTPVDVMYRGHAGRLFKRDFAGEMLDMFADLSLVDYGFAYHRDPHFPQDDVSWFLLARR